jgi:ABC-type lipoprotein export system ATPase subunit
MNNPDDQSVPSPPNTIPIVVSSGDTSAFPPPSEANTIPIVVEPDKARHQSLPPYVPSPIPFVVEPDDVVNQPPQPPPWVWPNDVDKQPPQPPPVQVETVLIAENLYKYSTDGTAEIKDVSFKLLKNELTCIMGREEDGVLSLLRVLALEEAVATGRLTILNKEISELSIEELNTFRDMHIAYIRQSHLDLAEQTGRMLVAYWLHYYDDHLRWDQAKEYAKLALNDVGITRQDIPIRELSIAQQSRISIAKLYARSNRHRCIYLFENLFASLTSLDQKSADELVQLLKEEARKGKVVVAQANRQDIASSFDQVLEMKDGELVQVR